LQIKTKIVSCHTADSKQVKQEVYGTGILPSLVFPVVTYIHEGQQLLGHLSHEDLSELYKWSLNGFNFAIDIWKK
jgi:hypothetical protein